MQRMEDPNYPFLPGVSTTNSSMMLPFGEFAEDLENNLGRANGNCYQRRPGIPNVHDGQIMVRLKKKRFIVIDYSIVPSPGDLAYAAVTPYVKTPPGAGIQKCTTVNCPKIGVPVCLFDSDPDEPISLYLRSGLCFTCQRHLNEKRRTQRKRKGETMDDEVQKRFRLNDQILDLDPDAIIINGQPDGTKHHGPGYGYPEILLDLQKIAQNCNHGIGHLSSAISTYAIPPLQNSPEHIEIEEAYHKAFQSFTKGLFLLSQWKSSFDTVMAAKSSGEVLEGTSIADVVASAAAVAAAQAYDSTSGGEHLSMGLGATDDTKLIGPVHSDSVEHELPMVDEHITSVSV